MHNSLGKPHFECISPMFKWVIDLANSAEATHNLAGYALAQEMVAQKSEFDAITHALSTGEGPVRRKALSLLYYWGTNEAAHAIAHALGHDPSAIIRHEAAYYLGALRNSDTIVDLISALELEQAELAKHEIAEALGDMGATTAIPALERALNDPREDVAETAWYAICQLRDGSLV